jgi:translation elongation factor EF-4
MDLERSAASPSRRIRPAVLHRRFRREVRLEPHRYACHVDFSYEVTRSLAACEGALLLVDASQGVGGADARQRVPGGRKQPRDHPVINKDRPAERPAGGSEAATEDIVGLPGENAILASAKMGTGVHDILEAIVKRLPPPPVHQTRRSRR